MAPSKIPASIDQFAELDHFYRLRKHLPPFTDIFSHQLPNPQTAKATCIALFDAVNDHEKVFPDDCSDHLGYRSLLATLTYFWMKEKTMCPTPSWCLMVGGLVHLQLKDFLADSQNALLPSSMPAAACSVSYSSKIKPCPIVKEPLFKNEPLATPSRPSPVSVVLPNLPSSSKTSQNTRSKGRAPSLSPPAPKTSDKDKDANKDDEEDADGSDNPNAFHPRPSNLKVGRPPKRTWSSSVKSEKGIDALSYAGFAACSKHALPGPPSKEALSVKDFPNLEESTYFNPPCCHGCNNNSFKNGPCTCKLCKWGVGCTNCIKLGKVCCTFALNAPEFLTATEHTFAMNAAHPQNLRASLNRVNFHLSSA
ncbi:hypothetical protein HYPSUDRAFT_209801 [Hypholoma sublateritium FD-334 SS-4]|uniref:Uncharacterized protein n=1 Tax=Hypholoma sublateritium (strain FD-334 SS-4) TaxID=945553 RepID=A0A0D2N8W3_HYPSF|nr:hypothetical protein HYPSUDRAFT_209801 [Hypholoma sublateritium FD-334 SS-4]